MIYFGFLAPYCRVDLERYERSPPKPYIRLSSNTAFHRILYVSICIYEIEYGILFTHFEIEYPFPPFSC